MIRILTRPSDLGKIKTELNKSAPGKTIDHQHRGFRRNMIYPCIVSVQMICWDSQDEWDAIYQFQSMKNIGMIPCVNNKVMKWAKK